MPHASVKLIPGANQTETPALNQAGVSVTSLVRYIYDRNLGALIQKLGGWTKYFPNTMAAKVRALWAWADTQSVTHLAFGTENIGVTSSAQLGVITSGTATTITPAYAADDVTAAASATSGSSIITITDATTGGITQYDTVFIATQISVGGVVLYGLYQCDPDGFIGATTYRVQAVNKLGTPVAATSTTTTTTVPLFSVTSGSSSVTVTLASHGYMVGDSFPVIMTTTVGGATFLGNYPVVSVVDANNFTITSTTLPASTTTGNLNGNKAHYIYNYGVGAISSGTGYGVGTYGSGGYGTGTGVTPGTGTAISASDWTLDNWGEILIACPISTSSPRYQPIFQWDSEGGAPFATVIANGPPVNDGVFVAMPQRQIIAWGTTFTGIQDPLLLRWCDVNNFNVWIGTTTNQAGTFRIPKGSRIVGAMQGPQQGLVFTDIGVWSMQYISQPYVYSFNEIGSGCGLIGRKAMGSISGAIYWMGPSQFFSLSEAGVQPVACDIWDVIFQEIDTTYASKIRCAVNSRFGEITWYFPTTSSGGEVAMYAKYNVYLKAWDYGALARSAWVDQSVLGAPIGADPTSLYLYQHETSTDADGQALSASFQTGYFAINDGNEMTYVDQVWPDMKWGYYGGAQNATVQMTFYVADYPGQTPRTYGPYSVTQATNFISPRFRGRLVSLLVASNDVGSFWRIGNPRYRFSADGRF